MGMDNDKFIDEIIEIIPVVSRLSRRFSQNTNFADECSIPPAQLQALIILSKFGTMNMTQLAEFLMMPRQQLTRIIDALVTKELVERKNDPENRRVILIEASSKGIEYLESMFYDKDGAVVKFFSLMDDEQRAKFKEAVRLFKEVFSSLTSE